MKLQGLATFLVSYISDNNAAGKEVSQPFAYIDSSSEEEAVNIAKKRMSFPTMGRFECTTYISDKPKQQAYTKNLSAPCAEKRVCDRCEGKGTTFRQGFTYENTTYPDKHEQCLRCDGVGYFSTPDYRAIFEAVTTGRGMPEGRRRVRASADKKWDHYRDRNGGRTYYVWRLARFSGGKDVTMPMMAGIAIAGDPFEPELSALSDMVAKYGFGTDRAGASRWGVLLGVISPDTVPNNLPSTAYEGGPVKL